MRYLGWDSVRMVYAGRTPDDGAPEEDVEGEAHSRSWSGEELQVIVKEGGEGGRWSVNGTLRPTAPKDLYRGVAWTAVSQ